jgi:hypothetical protein
LDRTWQFATSMCRLVGWNFRKPFRIGWFMNCRFLYRDNFDLEEFVNCSDSHSFQSMIVTSQFEMRKREDSKTTQFSSVDRNLGDFFCERRGIVWKRLFIKFRWFISKRDNVTNGRGKAECKANLLFILPDELRHSENQTTLYFAQKPGRRVHPNEPRFSRARNFSWDCNCRMADVTIATMWSVGRPFVNLPIGHFLKPNCQTSSEISRTLPMGTSTLWEPFSQKDDRWLYSPVWMEQSYLKPNQKNPLLSDQDTQKKKISVILKQWISWVDRIIKTTSLLSS